MHNVFDLAWRAVDHGAGRAVELAQASNDYALSFMSRYPERLSAFAAVPLQDPKAAIDELQRTVGKGDFVGVW